MPMSTLAISIGTTETPHGENDVTDYLNSRHIDILRVTASYRATPDSTIETEVLWRAGHGPESERDHLRAVLDWIHDRAPIDRILTYHGANYDERHLRGRAELLLPTGGDPTLDRDMHRLWTSTTHRDLMYDVKAAKHPMSLEAAVETYLDEQFPDVQWDGSTLSTAQQATLEKQLVAHRGGHAVMTADRAQQLRDTLTPIATAETRYLIPLYDTLTTP